MLRLTAGDAELRLAPEIGGTIVGWFAGGQSLMRETSAAALAGGDPGDMASFPLVPYSNRIARGDFIWNGSRYTLAVGRGDAFHAIHGIGWQREWTVEDESEDAARITLTHTPDEGNESGWPFAFRAEQSYRLARDRLTVSLAMTNTAPVPAPAGLGLHPYFPREDDTELQFAAGSVWLNSADMLPESEVEVPAGWDYRGLRRLVPPSFDNCFAGWEGRAVLRSPARGIAITVTAAPLFRHLVIYTTGAGDAVAIEPVSHMNDAVSRPGMAGHGLVSLAPGETLSGAINFELERG